VWDKLGLSHVAGDKGKEIGSILKGISAFANALKIDPFMTQTLTNIGANLRNLNPLMDLRDRESVLMSSDLALMWCIRIDSLLPQERKSQKVASFLLGGRGYYDALATSGNKGSGSGSSIGTSSSSRNSIVIADSVKKDAEYIKIANLVSVLCRHCVANDLSREQFCGLVRALIRVLQSNGVFEFLPSSCEVLVKLEAIIIIQKLGETSKSELEEIMAAANGVELILEVMTHNSHTIIIQQCLQLLKILEAFTPATITLATRLLEHQSLKVSDATIAFLHGGLCTKSDLVKVFVEENGLLLLDLTMQQRSKSRNDLCPDLRLLEALVSERFMQFGLKDTIRHHQRCSIVSTLQEKIKDRYKDNETAVSLIQSIASTLEEVHAKCEKEEQQEEEQKVISDIM